MNPYKNIMETIDPDLPQKFRLEIKHPRNVMFPYEHMVLVKKFGLNAQKIHVEIIFGKHQFVV